MGYKIGELFWKIEADTSDFKKDVTASETKTKSLGSSSTSAGKMIKAAFSVAAVAGVVAFSKAIVSAALEAEDAYQVQEAAIIKLNAALKTTGQYSDDASKDLQDYASELQGITTVGDETTLSLLQISINAGLTADQAKEATTQAVGLSKAFGVDLTAAIKATTNAQQGNYDMLNRYIPAVKNASDESEKAAIAQKSLADAFEIAKAEATTAAGVEEQLKNAIGDTKEIVGSYVSEALTPWRASLVNIVTEINNTMAAQKELSEMIKTGDVSSIATDLDELKGKLEALTYEVVNYGMGWETATAAQLKLRDELEKAIAAYDKLVESGNLANGYSLMRQAILAEEAEAQKEAAEAAAIAAEEERERAEADQEAFLERVTARMDARAAEEALEEMTAQALEERAERIKAAEEEQTAQLEAQAALREKIREAELSSTASILGSMSSIFGEFADDNTEAAIAEKALASAQAAINSYLAFTQVLASAEVPALAKPVVAAAVLASGLAQQASILSTEIPGYEDGGIVGGSSYNGDNVITAQNSGEMNINRADQQTLFNAIKSGNLGSSGGTFIMEVDGQALATILVNKINDGQGGTISGRVIS
jgi:cell pole-organizing protein PopZ